MKEILNVALIGCGWIAADKHLPAIFGRRELRL